MPITGRLATPTDLLCRHSELSLLHAGRLCEDTSAADIASILRCLVTPTAAGPDNAATTAAETPVNATLEQLVGAGLDLQQPFRGCAVALVAPADGSSNRWQHCGGGCDTGGSSASGVVPDSAARAKAAAAAAAQRRLADLQLRNSDLQVSACKPR